MSADDAPRPLRYDFGVTPGSTYTRAAGLIASSRLPGLVIDLGAGVGSLAEAVSTYGFDALCFDVDAANVDAMVQRGRQGHQLDLLAPDAFEQVLERFEQYVADQGETPVVAIAMLDVIEHLPDPDRTMTLLANLVEHCTTATSTPLVVLSVPNVAHEHLAAKLVLGRWDVTESGLLDSTHITLFTEQRLERLVGAHGFAEVARSDVLLEHSEQSVDDLPVLGATTLASLLRAVRSRSNDSGATYQFVRSFERVTGRSSAVHEPVPAAPTFCSVVVRTQGARSSLTDTLVALAAQSDDDFEVLLMVHSDDAAPLDPVRDLVASFAPRFAERVHVHHVAGGGRSAPLNAALDAAGGRYLAILDDDDIVTSDWIAAFRRAAGNAPGRTVRAGVVVQWIEQRNGGLLDYEAVSGFEAMYPEHFDFLDTVRANRSPTCCFAVPMEAVRSQRIRFDDSLKVCEDWKFQLEVVRATGVSDDDHVTSIYRRWRNDGGSQSAESVATWIRDHERVVDDLDVEPTLVPPGSLRRIHELYRRIETLEIELGRRSPEDPPFRFTE